MSYFDDELTEALSHKGIDYKILTGEQHETLSSIIQKKIKFSGSQISWADLNDAKNLSSLNKNEALNAIAEMLGQRRANRVFFLGDSAIEINIFCLNYAYQIGLTKLRRTSVAAYQKAPSISNRKF